MKVRRCLPASVSDPSASLGMTVEMPGMTVVMLGVTLEMLGGTVEVLRMNVVSIAEQGDVPSPVS